MRIFNPKLCHRFIKLLHMKLFPGKSLHQCFEWIYFILYYSGCLGFKIKNGEELYYNQHYKWYGYICRTILLSGFIGSFIIKIQDDELYQAMVGNLSPVVKFVFCFECSMSTLTYLQVIFFLDLTHKKHLKFAQNLQKLDEQMKKDFPGIQWNYHKSARKYNSLTLLLYVFYTVISVIYIFNLAHCSCGWLSSLIIAFSYSSVTAAAGCAEFLYLGVMDILRLRFRLIRKLVRQSFIIQNFKQRKTIKDLRKFKLSQYYFKEYSCLILSLNDIFGSVTAASIFHVFAVLTSMGFLLCSKDLQSKFKWYEYTVIMLFIAPIVYKVIMTAIYGYLLEKERRNCSHEFVKMENYFIKSLVVRDSLQSFLHWRMQNNYYVTVGRTLHCSLSLIFLVFNGVVNYIIILIQLQFQQNNIIQSFQNRNDLYGDVEIIKA